MYNETQRNLDSELAELEGQIEGATWEYPAYLSITSPVLHSVDIGIEYDPETETYELAGNEYEGNIGESIPLTGNETATELKVLVLELFKTIHEMKGN